VKFGVLARDVEAYSRLLGYEACRPVVTDIPEESTP
jgi:hypothetical protein